MREMTEIQKDLARLADRAFDLKKDLYRLIAEIEADDYSWSPLSSQDCWPEVGSAHV